jgi:hypothetical protein
MAGVDLKEKAISLLSSTPLVDMKTASTKRSFYTVPTGKKCIVTHICVREPTASLAGGSSYAFGSTATCNDWNAVAITLVSMTATTDAYTLTASSKVTIYTAAQVFGMYITTGSTLAATATVDVFGYLYDA